MKDSRLKNILKKHRIPLLGLCLLVILVFSACATRQDSLSAVRARWVLLV